MNGVLAKRMWVSAIKTFVVTAVALAGTQYQTTGHVDWRVILAAGIAAVLKAGWKAGDVAVEKKIKLG